MAKVQIRYNPYTVKTDIKINDKELDNKKSPLMYVNNKRLQEWIEPKGKWAGIYKELKSSTGDSKIELEYTGTAEDYRDLIYARDKYGDCFAQVELIHINKDTAVDISPYQKLQKLKELYQQLQDGTIEELKSDDIKSDFETAVNSEFRIVIVAPMSSGKSTLINAIAGRDLLPALNRATTAVVTEIKVNNELDDFMVRSAYDKDGKIIVENTKATGQLIAELNNKKDDENEEKALIRRICLEGPISGLTSDILNTVFVDTPGGNYVLKSEHGEIMDAAINDENKSLILFVFNAEQLGTNDSRDILQKIANTVQNHVDGKQSRDRFLFVANKMDATAPEKEPYEDIIKNTILYQLNLNHICEPKLFLVSAKTAQLIRMKKRKEKLSVTEEDELEHLIKRMSRSDRMLSQYASLPLTDKEKLMKEAKECMEMAGGSNDNEKERNKVRAAEINSGIPAVENAIKEYLEKYAIAIKIKKVHDAFMGKVTERRMIYNCEAEWARDKESFDAARAELQKKRDKYDQMKKMEEFKSQVEAIELDIRFLRKEKVRVIDQLDNLVRKFDEKVEYDVAIRECEQFRYEIAELGKRVVSTIDRKVNDEIRKACEDVISKYKECIAELDLEGIFSVGKFNMKEMAAFKIFDIPRADEFSQYIRKENVKVGSHMEKKDGIGGWFARLFGLESGYKKVDDYKELKYVKLRELVRDQVTETQHQFDQKMDEVGENTLAKVKELKDKTAERLEGLDKYIKDVLDDIDRMLGSQEELEKKVKQNKDKTEWIKGFVQQVETLLEV